MTVVSFPSRLLIAFASLMLALGTSAGSHLHGAAQNKAPQLTASVPSNGADLAAWPTQATLTFDQAITSARVSLTGPQGGVETGNVTTSGTTLQAVLPVQPSPGRYVLTFTAQNGSETATGSVAFTVSKSGSTQTVGAPSETGTTKSDGLLWVTIGVSALGGVILIVFLTRRRVVTQRRSGASHDPDRL